MQNRLKELRLAKHLNQKAVADIIGKTFQAYSFYERGDREPDVETLKVLADFYGVSIDYLLGREATTNKEVLLDKGVEIYNGLSEEQKEQARAFMNFIKSQASQK